MFLTCRKNEEGRKMQRKGLMWSSQIFREWFLLFYFLLFVQLNPAVERDCELSIKACACVCVWVWIKGSWQVQLEWKTSSTFYFMVLICNKVHVQRKQTTADIQYRLLINPSTVCVRRDHFFTFRLDVIIVEYGSLITVVSRSLVHIKKVWF